MGDRVDGRYELEGGPLPGGRTEVWLAKDTLVGQQVALKRVRMGHATSADDDFTHLRAEARALATFRQHPHVVTLFDAVQVTEAGATECWLVMEYAAGGSLAGREPMSPGDAARIGAQVAHALTALHAAGIVHCDVKPGNIVLDEEGTAKLTDLDSAYRLNGETITPNHGVSYTPDYAAPEVVQGNPKRASDVFSLGATVYELIVGQPPYAIAGWPEDEGYGDDAGEPAGTGESADDDSSSAHPAEETADHAWRQRLRQRRGALRLDAAVGPLDELLRAMLAPLPQQRPTADEVRRGFAEAAGRGGAAARRGEAPAPRPGPAAGPVHSPAAAGGTSAAAGKAVNEAAPDAAEKAPGAPAREGDAAPAVRTAHTTPEPTPAHTPPDATPTPTSVPAPAAPNVTPTAHAAPAAPDPTPTPHPAPATPDATPAAPTTPSAPGVTPAHTAPRSTPTSATPAAAPDSAPEPADTTQKSAPTQKTPGQQAPAQEATAQETSAQQSPARPADPDSERESAGAGAGATPAGEARALAAFAVPIRRHPGLTAVGALAVAALLVLVWAARGWGDGSDGPSAPRHSSPPRAAQSTPVDQRENDPCALLDTKALSRFGSAQLDRYYGNFDRCDVLVRHSETSEVDIKLDLSNDPPSDVAPPARTVGRIGVGEVSADDEECTRSVLPIGQDPYSIYITAHETEAGPAPLCAMADATATLVAKQLDEGPIPRRTTQPPADSLQRLDACTLLDARALSAVPGIDAADPDVGYGNWECEWQSTTSNTSAELRFDRGQTKVEPRARHTRLGGHAAYVEPGGGDEDACRVRVEHREYTDHRGRTGKEAMYVVVSGAGAMDELCTMATGLATSAAAGLPPLSS
ncbi:protein kinase [Streptomyces sp. HSW2009]|uniref:serine/threonine-protein kinase n=1 Tax=Streptomyces sp. HSW2009 TaxID=3142890 RepID=UPI0032EC5459